jgi:phosphohistidine phosphatase
MQIYLLRHGIAEDARPGLSDADRALTPEGKEKLRRVLKRAAVAPSLILSSPFKRAVETADLAAQVLDYAGKVVRVEALVPHGSAYAVWDELRARKEETAVLLAGHEPLMSSIAAFLLDSPALQVDMKKAALVRIDCERLGPKPGGVLKWMLTPAVSE